MCEPIERLTGRKVRAFSSGIDTPSRIAVGERDDARTLSQRGR
jgi:hypothetical protein